MSSLEILAPVSGRLLPLSGIPDPVIASGLLGDGVAIDPSQTTVHAPCDGIVVAVHAARHAAALSGPNGEEILVHVGIDTVALEGRGFTLHVREDQSVKAGDPLISFNPDIVQARCSNLSVIVVVAGGQPLAVVDRHLGPDVVRGERLFTVRSIGD